MKSIFDFNDDFDKETITQAFNEGASISYNKYIHNSCATKLCRRLVFVCSFLLEKITDYY